MNSYLDKEPTTEMWVLLVVVSIFACLCITAFGLIVDVEGAVVKAGEGVANEYSETATELSDSQPVLFPFVADGLTGIGIGIYVAIFVVAILMGAGVFKSKGG